MATYLSRLIERAGGEAPPESRAETVMPAPESTDPVPGLFDPFEETIIDAVDEAEPAKKADKAGEPPARSIPTPASPPPKAAAPPETLVSEGLPLLPTLSPAAPPLPETAIEDSSQNPLPEQLVIERWHEDAAQAPADLPPPRVIERDVYITGIEREDEDRLKGDLLPPAPKEPPAPLAVTTESPAPDALQPPSADFPDLPERALDPPAEPPVTELADPASHAPAITIGDVVVEIVATARHPEPASRSPAPVMRPVERPAPRHGVRSKRRFGIGQS
jgi:hypothetical protein